MSVRDSRASKTAERRRKLISLYIGTLFDWLTNGKYVLPEVISSIGLKPLYDRILTKNAVSKVYNLYGFPVRYSRHLVEELRNECFMQNERVKIQFNFNFDFMKDLDVQGQQFTSSMNRAYKDFQLYNSEFQKMEEQDKIMGKRIMLSPSRSIYITEKDLRRLEDIKDSYTSVHKKGRNRDPYFITTIFIHVSAPTSREVNKFEKILYSKLYDHGLKYSVIRGFIHAYLRNYCPAGFRRSDAAKMNNAMLSDDNIAQLLPASTIGMHEQVGTLMGVNVRNALPFFLRLFDSGSGQVFCFLGKTGSGKTYGCFEFVLSLLSQHVHVSVTDLKGNEWNKLCDFTESVVINLEGRDARFVNSLRLDDMIGGDRDDAKEAYQLAVQGTVTLLLIICNVEDNIHDTNDLFTVLEQSVIKLYNSKGVVSENSETFRFTKNLQYTNIIPFLRDVKTTTDFTEHMRELCSYAATKIDLFFSSSGRYAEAFKNEVTIQEIYDAPLVIYALNKNTTLDLDVLDTIKVFMSQFLSVKKNSLRKRKGLHSLTIAEEVQRYVKGSKIVTFLSDTTTGGRSQNVMVAFLLNSISKLETVGLYDIIANITTFIIGRIEKTDREYLMDKFDLSDIASDLKDVSEDGGKLEHTFVCKYNTGSSSGVTLYKAFLPKYMENKLQTRDIEKPINTGKFA